MNIMEHALKPVEAQVSVNSWEDVMDYAAEIFAHLEEGNRQEAWKLIIGVKEKIKENYEKATLPQEKELWGKLL
ncbi:MAG: hypothetical protein GXN92_00165, partial [Candidatus Micrarchaeota archaeon]|nr:hypothetical protein [Candidatus Micrarchaeota archaeon]